MTLQQLEYVIALASAGNFSTAAQNCHIAQPSLSTAIAKLEDELGVQLFDRSQKPIVATPMGLAVVQQAKEVLRQAASIPQMVSELKDHTGGLLHVGIIPTLASYLIPLFLPRILEQNPDIDLHLSERTTNGIIEKLLSGDLDVGILATPLNVPNLVETPIFEESFVVYAPNNPELLSKRFVFPEEIDLDRLYLLEEGHCLRSQVMNLCALQRQREGIQRLTYETGSLDTLRKLVELGAGITILPELSLLDMTEEQIASVRFFQSPTPTREISLLTHKDFVKKGKLNALKSAILESLPKHLSESRGESRRISLS